MGRTSRTIRGMQEIRITDVIEPVIPACQLAGRQAGKPE